MVVDRLEIEIASELKKMSFICFWMAEWFLEYTYTVKWHTQNLKIGTAHVQSSLNFSKFL